MYDWLGRLPGLIEMGTPLGRVGAIGWLIVQNHVAFTSAEAACGSGLVWDTLRQTLTPIALANAADGLSLVNGPIQHRVAVFFCRVDGIRWTSGWAVLKGLRSVCQGHRSCRVYDQRSDDDNGDHVLVLIANRRCCVD